jgi:transaldolase
MKFFLDSAHVHEIEYALQMWNLDGVTTNPRHVQASGKPFLTVIREIGALFAGTDKPISVEVNLIIQIMKKWWPMQKHWQGSAQIS